MNANFCSLWLVPAQNRTRVYRFINRLSIYSTTDLPVYCYSKMHDRKRFFQAVSELFLPLPHIGR